VRGVTLSGDAAETSGSRMAAPHGRPQPTRRGAAGGWYIPAGGVGIAGAPLIEKLAAAGEAGRRLPAQRQGTDDVRRDVTIQGQADPKKVQLAFVRGILPSPVPVWLDEDRRFFADIGYISTIPAGHEGALKQLRDAQEAATAAEIKSVARRFLTPAARAPVLFDNVRLFDADRGLFLANRAVLARDGKVAAIGAAGSLKARAGTRVIDGRGKTLVPGIWDSHMHIGDDWAVLSNVANGITSFRSPGTTFDRAIEATSRRASGRAADGRALHLGHHRQEGSARRAGSRGGEPASGDASPPCAGSRTAGCGASSSTPR
jgi:hypothetical protein